LEKLEAVDAYVRPELVELGDAEDLILGCNPGKSEGDCGSCDPCPAQPFEPLPLPSPFDPLRPPKPPSD
jgi:hypothetical protein